MRFSFSSATLLVTASAFASLGFSSCRTNSKDKVDAKAEPEYVARVHQNNLSQQPSSLLLGQAQSKVNWQSWSKSVFADAAKEQKTVFAFIGHGNDPHTIQALEQLNHSTPTCHALNRNHVNVLVDGNLHPELVHFSSALCLKSTPFLRTPVLIWFSHEGIPISWIPLNRLHESSSANFINRTSQTVHRVWRESPDYVLRNSRDDFTRRLSNPLPEPSVDEENMLAIRASRQIASLFNPTSSTVDSLGEISIARFIQLLISASQHPDTSQRQKEHYINIASQTADNMMLRGLIDPLDGGIFSSPEQSTTDLPVFAKQLRSQAYSMEALYTLYQTTGKTRFLDAANRMLAFTRHQLGLQDGGYQLGVINAYDGSKNNSCLWTLEQLESILSPKEVSLCVQAFDIKGLGNIPLVDDPNRRYFRQNTLTWKHAPEALARMSGLDAKTLDETLQSITKKLAKHRTDQSPNPHRDQLCTTESMALMTNAYISAYRATGNSTHLDDATKTLSYIRSHLITPEGAFKRARFNGQTLAEAARGIDYARLTQAALNLHQVTLDSNWLNLAVQSHTAMTENLGNSLNHQILESDGSTHPYPYSNYAILNYRALNNGSTWALAYYNARRLAKHQAPEPLLQQADELLGYLTTVAQSSPVNAIDFLTLENQLQLPEVYLKSPSPPALLKAAVLQACQIIPVSGNSHPQHSQPELKQWINSSPNNEIIIIQRNKIIGTTNQAEQLSNLLP